MKQVLTGDGSPTFYSEKYGETYKSTSGAMEEAQKKFVLPCKIADGMRILDIGFGLGYNVAVALSYAKNLSVVSLENDPEILKQVQTLEVPLELQDSYGKVKRCAAQHSYSDASCDLKLILGDATQTIHEVEGVFDACFLDPFSPKKNPELWTAEFFSEIFKKLKPGAILATYSCAGNVRRNLKGAGFEVRDGPVVGRRAPSTIAVRPLT
ncbi:MAG: tRNA (5-methylaminomethyl-2-thiouridine)(34)-methyltransferase MnmD [Nanoarchaeota archaeon]|nr:tRNA (5-methylaminomethyl-2-thiouridine)(34)-methyltransferase MnmD [Nanoarchaeota archaeon]